VELSSAAGLRRRHHQQNNARPAGPAAHDHTSSGMRPGAGTVANWSTSETAIRNCGCSGSGAQAPCARARPCRSRQDHRPRRALRRTVWYPTHLAGRCGGPADHWRCCRGILTLKKCDAEAERPPARRYAATPSVNGITSLPTRSISSNCGLHCSNSRFTPASWNSRTRSATCSAVPVSPARSPRLLTE
jgi:hypothetical protein